MRSRTLGLGETCLLGTAVRLVLLWHHRWLAWRHQEESTTQSCMILPLSRRHALTSAKQVAQSAQILLAAEVQHVLSSLRDSAQTSLTA